MLRVEIWMTTTFFAVGIIAAMTYLDFSNKSNAGDSKPKPVQVASIPIEGETSSIQEIPDDDDPEIQQDNQTYGKLPLQLGDRFLLAGNYALALEKYYECEKKSREAGTSIIIREAFCFEKQKKYELAQKKYYRTYTTSSNENHRLLAVAGFARCLVNNGQRSAALDLLAAHTLKLDQYENVPSEIRAELSFHFATTLQSLVVPAELDLTEPTGVAFEENSSRPDFFLSVIDQPATQLVNVPNNVGNTSFSILQRPTTSLNTITASVSTKLESVLVSVGQIAVAAEVDLFVSPQAQAVLKDRSRTIELRACPLGTVLDRLLVSFDLVWYQNGTQLYVVAQKELDPSSSPNQFWFDAADRAFRRFELSYQADSRRHSALLARANLNLIQRRFDLAGNQFQRLTQAQPADEVLAKLFFNQGKLQMLLGENAEASRFFYFAVDQTLNPNIESSSYCLLGANHLSEGDLENAIKVSRRAVSTAINAKQKRVGALNLARAYLLNQDPFSANSALFKNREYFDEASKSIASVLGAYARFIGVSDERGIKTARNRLLSAIAMLSDETYESFADCYVAGLAFETLGFREKAVDKLLLALSKPDVGQYKRQILYELGLLQKRLGQLPQAQNTLQLLVQDDDIWAKYSLNQLAEIFAESNQTDLCIETCKKLWQSELTDAQKKSALQVLGFAYQQRGEHHSAALCFAGMLPSSF